MLGVKESGMKVCSLAARNFLFEGLELEPELSLVFGSGYSAYILNGNLAYNIIVYNKDYAFVLAGYGYSNALPFLNGVPIQYGSSSTSFGVMIQIYPSLGSSATPVVYNVKTVSFGFSIFV